MRRSWIPVRPQPKVGKRVPHVLRVPSPEEDRPLADLDISAKVLNPLEAMGIMTIADLAKATSRQVAGIQHLSLDVIRRFKDYCASRQIPTSVKPSEVWKIRLHQKQVELERNYKGPPGQMPKLKSKMPSRTKKRNRKKS